MANITDNNYVVIQSWMSTKLKLSGGDLIVFAIVYSFSQDGESEFRGSINYIKNLVGKSRDTVIRSLKYLESRKFVKKVDHNTKDGKTNGYIVDFDTIAPLLNRIEGGIANCDTPHSNSLYGGSQNATGGIANCDTINKYIIKDIKEVSMKEKTNIDKPINTPRVYARKSYQELMDAHEIPERVQFELWRFIQHCHANGQVITNDRLQSLWFKLKKLYRLSDVEGMVKALRTAIDRGYYDIKDGESWIVEAVDAARAQGVKTPFDVVDEE